MKYPFIIVIAIFVYVVFVCIGYDKGIQRGYNLGSDVYAEKLQKLNNDIAEAEEMGYKRGICVLAKHIYGKKNCEVEYTGTGYLLNVN